MRRGGIGGTSRGATAQTRFRQNLLGVLALVVAAALPGAASGKGDQAQLHLTLFASGLDSPTYAGAPRGQTGRLYVVERPGVIRVFVNGHLRAEPFLDIRRLVGSSGEEQGLLSVAFHPRYTHNHRFYVDYTDVNGDTRVVEYRSNGSVGVPSTARRLLFVHQPYANHNGGQLQFGPDGRLYVGMGDGGSGGDPENRAENLGSQLGKLLRLNVNKRGVRWQIAGYGLRNPWRFSWDPATHDLYIGDVGQDSWEEIDVRTRAQQRVLANYGWRVFEGRSRHTSGQKINPRGRLVFPIAVYIHGNGNCSVTGGYVYRGKQVPAARGRYFYGDYCTGTVWSLRAVKGKLRSNRRESIRVPSLSSFGEDAAGELYAVSLDGQIYQLAP
jgi:glucose/arabinose dehydrogenase